MVFIFSMLSFLYILAAGNIGLFAVKRRIPFLYPSGTIVVKGYDSGYCSIDYATFKHKHKWNSIFGPKDNRVTHVGKPQNIENSTGIPILFLKEGEIANFDPFNAREPEKGSELYSEILIAEHAAGYNEAKQKFEANDKLQMIAAVLSLISVVLIFGTAIIVLGQVDLITQIATKVDELAPAIQGVKDALGGISRIE